MLRYIGEKFSCRAPAWGKLQAIFVMVRQQWYLGHHKGSLAWAFFLLLKSISSKQVNGVAESLESSVWCWTCNWGKVKDGPWWGRLKSKWIYCSMQPIDFSPPFGWSQTVLGVFSCSKIETEGRQRLDWRSPGDWRLIGAQLLHGQQRAAPSPPDHHLFLSLKGDY